MALLKWAIKPLQFAYIKNKDLEIVKLSVFSPPYRVYNRKKLFAIIYSI